MVFGRESGTTGKASHRGHGGHRGGIWVGGEEFDRRQSWRLARIGRNGESIAQRSQRSQRGIGVGGQEFDRRQHGIWARIRCSGVKHRTEVTEVTKKGLGSAARKSIGDNHGVWARIRRNGVKHRTEVTEGGFGLVARNSIGDNMVLGRESGTTGKASHRGHGGHREGIGVGGQEVDR